MSTLCCRRIRGEPGTESQTRFTYEISSCSQLIFKNHSLDDALVLCCDWQEKKTRLWSPAGNSLLTPPDRDTFTDGNLCGAQSSGEAMGAPDLEANH